MCTSKPAASESPAFAAFALAHHPANFPAKQQNPQSTPDPIPDISVVCLCVSFVNYN